MNTCTICKHSDVDQINSMVTSKVPLRNIVALFDGITLSSVNRHKKNCVTDLFAEVRAAKRAGLLANVDAIHREIKIVREMFTDNSNVRLGLIGKMLDAVEKEARLTGAYQDNRKNQTDIDLAVTGYRQWLVEYPDASDEDRNQWVGWFADGHDIERDVLAREIRVREISSMIQ